MNDIRLRIITSIILLILIIYFDASANIIGQTLTAVLCVVMLFFDDWNGAGPWRFA